MTQPPNPQGPNPQGPNPQDSSAVPPPHPEGQPQPGPIGPDGQPYNGPIGPDGQPQPGTATAAPPKSNPFGLKKLLSALLVVVVLGVGAYFIWGNQQKSTALTVGNCLVWSGENQEDLDVKVVDCSDDTVYSEYVGEVLDGDGTCTDPGAVPYSLGATGEADDADKLGCVIPQLFQDKCYSVTDDQNIELVSCESSQLRVTKVIEESDAACEATDSPVSYVLPARTYCLAVNE